MEHRDPESLIDPAAVVTTSAPDMPSTSDGAEAGVEGEGPAGTGYLVHLDRFEGPLDLLLFLIKRDKIEITDIPIAHITEQYLASIREIVHLDLDRAGEFLLMAASLMRIKAKMLIPREAEEEAEEEIDPRQELVRRLMEYKEFKRVGEDLAAREEEWRSIFRRMSAPMPDLPPEDSGEIGASLVDLFRAFQKVLDAVPNTKPFQLIAEEYSVDERIEVLRRECFVKRDGVTFSAIFPERRSRALVITTFLALLEMVRRGEIVALQADSFGEILLKLKEVYVSHDS